MYVRMIPRHLFFFPASAHPQAAAAYAAGAAKSVLAEGGSGQGGSGDRKRNGVNRRGNPDAPCMEYLLTFGLKLW